MGMERRGCIDELYLMVNQQWEEALGKAPLIHLKA